MEESGSGRRRLKRYVQRIPVRFQSAGLRGQGHIKNLHKEGLFIRSSLLPDPGAEVSVSFESRDGAKIEVEGVVRWTTEQIPAADSHSGFGVLLTRVDDYYVRFFEQILLQ